ncbi:MAG: bifunctional riboflavin kinase/FAD synthetase [Rhizobiaceae bacterium]
MGGQHDTALGPGRMTGGMPLPERWRGGVVAIGNFDGVHRGHQAVLDRALAAAAKLTAPALVLTFEPHPRTFFNPEKPVHRITPAPMKTLLLRHLGADAIVEYPFDGEFAARTAEEFVSDILIGELGIVGAITGFDFHFGKDRQGGPAYLMDAGRRLGFSVDLVDAFRDEAAEVISSSRIRDCLATGRLGEANGLLGYHYTVSGTVIGGRKLGRTLGYPTANIRLAPESDLQEGIYAVRLRRADGSLHDGVASFGRRPTVEADGEALLEVYVFDFDGDLYGETCAVSLFGFLRGEEKFDGLDALTAQMRRDEAEARALLAGATPLGQLDRTLAFAP